MSQKQARIGGKRPEGSHCAILHDLSKSRSRSFAFIIRAPEWHERSYDFVTTGFMRSEKCETVRRYRSISTGTNNIEKRVRRCTHDRFSPLYKYLSPCLLFFFFFFFFLFIDFINRTLRVTRDFHDFSSASYLRLPIREIPSPIRSRALLHYSAAHKSNNLIISTR